MPNPDGSPKLDGSEKIAPTPYDAHDRVLRASDPDAEPQECPKHVTVKDDDGKSKTVVVANATEEKALKASAKAVKASAKAVKAAAKAAVEKPEE